MSVQPTERPCGETGHASKVRTETTIILFEPHDETVSDLSDEDYWSGIIDRATD